MAGTNATEQAAIDALQSHRAALTHALAEAQDRARALRDELGKVEEVVAEVQGRLRRVAQSLSLLSDGDEPLRTLDYSGMSAPDALLHILRERPNGLTVSGARDALREVWPDDERTLIQLRSLANANLIRLTNNGTLIRHVDEQGVFVYRLKDEATEVAASDASQDETRS